MSRRKHPRPPPNPTAFCRLHQRIMNDTYIHRRRCLFKGKPICKHLEWLAKRLDDKKEDNHHAKSISDGGPTPEKVLPDNQLRITSDRRCQYGEKSTTL